MNLENKDVLAVISGEWADRPGVKLCLDNFRCTPHERTGGADLLLLAKVVSATPHVGLWVELEADDDSTQLAQMFIPWGAIITILVADKERVRSIGFRSGPDA